ncbi:early endosome antigen 1-like [Fundulus heteroclitus]|uniref:early endosome antigen 1-like n=1 Tax=Fundulus heteroclitus TaxID=8078 RepID=UPI00165A9E17|nr:early endosome antigen 1-like [Fundulus heteroclitus]
MEEEVVAEDASFSREADAEEVNNGSYRSEDEPDEEGQENEEENVMEEEQEPPIIEPQDLEIPTTKRESVAELKKLWEQPSGRESQIHTSTNTTSEKSSTTHKTSCEEITTSSKSEKHVTGSSIDKSEVYRLKQLNDRLYKTITSLKKQNDSLKFTVERLTRKESRISSISLDEEKRVLEEKNKSLQEMLTDQRESLEKERKIRIQAEDKLWTLEREQKELKLENEELKNKITIKEKTISQLTEMHEREEEQTLETMEITRKGGFNVDTVDGVGIDVEELRKRIFKSAEEKFTDIERKYKTKVEKLTKTVTEKEAELTKAREENSDHTRLIEDYEMQISFLNERLAKAKTQHSKEISRLNKEIQKSKEEIKAMEEKIEFNSQTVEETTKVEMKLDTELNIYEEYLDLMEGRIKSHETEKSAGGEEILKTTKKTEMETKYSEAYSHQESHEHQHTQTSVSQHEEAEKQGMSSPAGDAAEY